jgi:hypothetical protein
MRRRLLLVVVSFVLVLGAWAGPAAAQDVHSPNMTRLFASGNATGAVNSDLAFWGDRAYAGNYDGFRIFDISNPASPQTLADVRCHGLQADPIVWKNKLLFLAVDRTQTGPECGATDTPAHDDPNGWEGVRIFDVSDPSNVRHINSVYTDCGAHTITMYPKSKWEVLLYVSSYPLRPGPTCGPLRGPEAGNSPLHEKISVISVPTRKPEKAKVIAQPKIVYPGDPDGTFRPVSEHDFGGQGLLDGMTACHDIAVYVPLRLAAAACAEQGQVWRIKRNGIPDTKHPLWVYDDARDTDGPGGGDVAVDFWHSATFSWDGKIVNFIDESFAGFLAPDNTPVRTCPPISRVSEAGPLHEADTGAMFFFKTRTGEKLSHLQFPREAEGYCSAHLGNVVPTKDRYLLVNAWYDGGANVIDFTDPRNPTEVAYYDAAPDPAHEGDMGQNNWSAYWYEGPATDRGSLTVYASDHHETDMPPSPRGFDVFKVDLGVRDEQFGHLNPQTQEEFIKGPRRKR